MVFIRSPKRIAESICGVTDGLEDSCVCSSMVEKAG